MDEVSRFRKLAKSGHITAQVVNDGVALHRSAMAEFDAFIAEDSYREGLAESIRPGLELHIYCDSATFISAAQRLAVRDPRTRKLVQEIFPVYAQRGIVALVKISGGRLGSQFSPNFAEELEEYRAMRDYLDGLMFMILSEALYRNKLMPIKEHLFETIMYRIGLDATQRAMDHIKSIRG